MPIVLNPREKSHDYLAIDMLPDGERPLIKFIYEIDSLKKDILVNEFCHVSL